MADETPNETQADREAAEKDAQAFVTEQERLLALSHADDRPAETVAALAPRNRPIDGEVRVVRAPEVRGDVEEFTDPARGLEPGNVTKPEVPGTPVAERHTPEDAEPLGSGAKGKGSKTDR